MPGYRRPLVYLHIPKTGGTTIHDLLSDCFASDRVCSGVQREENNRLDRLPRERLRDCDFFSGHFHRRSIEVLGNQSTVFTVLREPKSRILSLYYFWKAHRPAYVQRKGLPLPGLAHWYGLLEFLRCPTLEVASNIKDVYVRLLLHPGTLNPKSKRVLPEDEAVTRAKEYLDSLFEVGVTENLDSFIPRLFRRLDLPVPSSVPRKNSHRDVRRGRSMRAVQREEMTGEIEGELDRLTRLDQIIYRHACERIHARAA